MRKGPVPYPDFIVVYRNETDHPPRSSTVNIICSKVDMSWFDTSFSFAKQAMNTAQRSIDRVLDIQEEGGGNGDFATPSKLRLQAAFHCAGAVAARVRVCVNDTSTCARVHPFS